MINDHDAVVFRMALGTDEFIGCRFVNTLRDARRISGKFELTASSMLIKTMREAEAKRAEWAKYGRKLAAILVTEGKALRWLGE